MTADIRELKQDVEAPQKSGVLSAGAESGHARPAPASGLKEGMHAVIIWIVLAAGFVDRDFLAFVEAARHRHVDTLVVRADGAKPEIRAVACVRRAGGLRPEITLSFGRCFLQSSARSGRPSAARRASQTPGR